MTPANDTAYERECERLEGRELDDDDFWWAALTGHVDTNGENAMAYGFEESATEVGELSESAVYDPEAIGADEEPEAPVPTPCEEDAREDEVVDAFGMLSESSRLRLLGDLIDTLPVGERLPLILGRICALGEDAREVVERELIRFDVNAYEAARAEADDHRGKAEMHAAVADQKRAEQRGYEARLVRLLGPFSCMLTGAAE